MNFYEYIYFVMWGRLGLTTFCLVSFLSTLLTIIAASKGVPVAILIILLIGPPVLYQLLSAAAATILWFATKDWNKEL